MATASMRPLHAAARRTALSASPTSSTARSTSTSLALRSTNSLLGANRRELARQLRHPTTTWRRDFTASAAAPSFSAKQTELDPDDAYSAQLDASGMSTVGSKTGMNEVMGLHPAQKVGVLPGPFQLQLGGVLPEVDVAYEEWGKINDPEAPVIVVLPSFSMGSHARSSPENPARGWWEPMIGPGKSIDTDKYRVICASSLGAPFGTTCPLSINPATNEPYRSAFPQITPHDMAKAHVNLVRDVLKIPRVFAVVGGSLGGMLALHIAVDFPEFAEKMVCLAATGRTSPGTVALRSAQRTALSSDPKWKDGNFDPEDPPFEGMAKARQLGMMFYRSRDEFDEKFGWKASEDHSFEVEDYLKAQGTKFASRFDPHCWMLMSKSMDLMDVARHHGDSLDVALGRVKAHCLFVGFVRDQLIPSHETSRIARAIQRHHSDTKSINAKHKPPHVEYLEHSSVYGHDAFLKEFDWMNSNIDLFFERD